MSLQRENEHLRKQVAELKQQLQRLGQSFSCQEEDHNPELLLSNPPLNVVGITEATDLKPSGKELEDSSHLFHSYSHEIGLQDSEALFRAYVETANDMVYTVDLAGRLTFMNSYGQRLLGYSEAELIGQLYLDFVAPAFREKTAQAFATVLQIRELKDFQFMLQPKVGPAIPMQANGRVLYRSGELIGAIGIARDITERKLLERHSEALFRAYVETATDIVYTVDLTGALTFMNSYGQRLLGYSEAELIGQFYLDLVAPAFREKTGQAFATVLQAGELKDFQFMLQPKVGPAIPMQANGGALYRNGELIGAIGIARDITERKRFEQQLQMFLKAIESAYDSAVIADLKGYVLYANSATSRMFNYELEALKGQNVSIFYPEEERAQWLIQQASAQGWSGEVICQRQAGERFTALVSVGLICDEQGNPTAVCVNSRDITDQKQIQAELAANNVELERASRLKSEFLANVSHELRTPLTSVLGFSSLLKKQVFGTLNPKQLEYIHHIHESGNHLLSLINDVLDLSKVEAGQISLNLTPISVFDLCQSTLALVSEQAGSRGLLVHQAIQSNLSPLLADELRVKQMLLNLLSNAIKFSEEGGEIGLEAKMQAGYLLLTVWDKGIGIPKEKYHLLFQPFQQLDSSLDRRYGGTGLGLALTRQMAELHGGTVEFESKVGQGSRFTIRLPFNPDYEPSEERATGAEETQAQVPQTTKAAQVLIVEDRSVNALFLQDILQYWGYETHHVANGLQAIDWLASHQPNLILMDINLPGLDGLETTRRIKANPKWKRIPVVAITALAMLDDRDRCLAAGLQDYISKPFNYKELATVIAKYTMQNRGQ